MEDARCKLGEIKLEAYFDTSFLIYQVSFFSRILSHVVTSVKLLMERCTSFSHQFHFLAHILPFSMGGGDGIPPELFQIVVWKKTLESPLKSKEIKPVNSKGNQP